MRPSIAQDQISKVKEKMKNKQNKAKQQYETNLEL